MKIVINETQYKRLIKESFPDDVDISIGDEVNENIVKIFEWCHKNTPIKQKFGIDVDIESYQHIIPKFAREIGKKLAFDKETSLVLSYNFFIRYNEQGNYRDFLGEDLMFFGEFIWKGNVNVTSKTYAVAEESEIWVYARNHNDAEDKISYGIHHDEIMGDVEVDGFAASEWVPEGEIDTDKGETEYS